MYEYQLTINLDKQCFLKVIFPLGFEDICPWMEGSRESLNKMTPLPTEQAAQKKGKALLIKYSLNIPLSDPAWTKTFLGS